MNKKLQLNSKFEFNNNFFFISPLLHEYSFSDPRSGPGILATVNMPKAAAQSRVGKVEKTLGGFGEKKNRKPKKKVARGRAGIEPATSPTRRENHTSRPTALIGDDRRASNEDRTRDLVLTKHMLCQLSYRGEVRISGNDAWPKARNKTEKGKKSILDGIRTRNPQIRSLVRYPLRHEYLEPWQEVVLPCPDRGKSEQK